MTKVNYLRVNRILNFYYDFKMLLKRNSYAQ